MSLTERSLLIGAILLFLLGVWMTFAEAHHRPCHQHVPGKVVLCMGNVSNPELAYRILSYGTTPGQYSTQLNVGLASNVSLNLPCGQTYYFAADGYDAQNVHIAESNEMSRRLQ